MTGVVIVGVFVVVIILVLSRCTFKCGGVTEGMSHRVPTTRVLLDNTYGRKQLPDYSLKWDYQGVEPDTVEKYTLDHECRARCQNVMGNTPNEDCYQACMNSILTKSPSMNIMTRSCNTKDDCDERELCVSPSYYGGSERGYCMSDNEPGIMRIDIPSLREREGMSHLKNGCGDIESFGYPQTCIPEYYFNEWTDKCEPRFQGSSSAFAIQHSKPGPPPLVSLPGSTFPGYGVGYMDPVNVPVRGTHLMTDQ